jgi:sugar phosphate permease
MMMMMIVCSSAGFGSIGTVIEGPLIGWMVEHYGWAGPFYFMIGLSCFGSLCMFKATRIDDAIKKSQFMSQLAAES